MPSTSTQSRFLRPAASWVMTAEPATSAAVRNRMMALSSVVTSTSGASLSTVLKAAAPAGRAAGRCLMLIEVVATSEAIRSPVTHSTRSHQCEPMSPKAREGPPAAGSTRQLVESGLSSQSCR